VCVFRIVTVVCFWGAVGQRGRRLERGWSFYDALSCRGYVVLDIGAVDWREDVVI